MKTKKENSQEVQSIKERSLAQKLKAMNIVVQRLSPTRWIIGDINVSLVQIYHTYRVFGLHKRSTSKNVYAYSRVRSHEEIESHPYGKGFFADTLKEIKEEVLEREVNKKDN